MKGKAAITHLKKMELKFPYHYEITYRLRDNVYIFTITAGTFDD